MIKPKNRLKLLFLLIILSVVFLLFIFFVKSKSKKSKTFHIGSANINVEIADTDAKRSQGLSDRTNLPDNTGMLFLFPKSGIYPFWMKDMHFPLDFIWISNKKVSDITEKVPNPQNPGDQLPLYSSREPVDMVLEVNAGFVEKNHIKIGDRAEYN